MSEWIPISEWDVPGPVKLLVLLSPLLIVGGFAIACVAFDTIGWRKVGRLILACLTGEKYAQ